MESEAYRQRAEDCLRLAEECREPFVEEALRQLANDFLREAEELEGEARVRGMIFA
jgi:hypothetical protein